MIGISARLATEKGVEVLLKALPLVLAVHPEALVLHASPPALGEEEYAARLAPLFAQYKDYYRRLNTLTGAELTAFYQNLDVLVISSLNSTESFGLVQIEAMMNGVPVAASNLPGVRQPVSMTGMGRSRPLATTRRWPRRLFASCLTTQPTPGRDKSSPTVSAPTRPPPNTCASSKTSAAASATTAPPNQPPTTACEP